MINALFPALATLAGLVALCMLVMLGNHLARTMRSDVLFRAASISLFALAVPVLIATGASLWMVVRIAGVFLL